MNANAEYESSIVTAVFRTRADVEQGWRAAVDLGYRSEDIELLLSEQTRDRLFGDARPSGITAKANEVVEERSAAEKLGGPTGGHIGVIAPVLAGVGTLLLIPGGILAAGPVAIALGAAGAVGLAGGVITALTNWGVPKGRVEIYEKAIRDGGVLLGVKPRSQEDADKLVAAWQASGGERVHS